MTDSTLNRFLARGTNAQRVAFTPDPPTPASGPSNTYFWHETDTGDTFAWNGSSWNQVNSGLSDGDKGDITVTSGVWTIDNDAVTYAKMQNVSATDKLLGRSTAGAGDVEEITCTAAGRALLDDVDAAAQRATMGCNRLLFGITIDGGGSVITTGVKGFVRIPVAHTITKATALSSDSAATSGSIVVDVWRDTYANYPPTDLDSITSSAPVTISSATKSEDSTLTGWNKTGSAGDIYGFNVDSVTSLTKVIIEIEATY